MGTANYARLLTMLNRQYPPRFGSQYIPSILATKQEAPSISKASQIPSRMLGRNLHALSDVEVGLLLIVEYLGRTPPVPGSNIKLLDAHEQKLLPFAEDEHPFTPHPAAAGVVLPTLAGTLNVAAALGYLKYHPTVLDECEQRAPYAWVGDCLLFLQDECGPYCTNLTAKASAQDFEQPIRRRRKRSEPDERTVARHAIEEKLYADAGIATVRVVSSELHPTLVGNLWQMLTWQHRAVEMGEDQKREVIEAFRDAAQRGERPLDVMLTLCHGHRTTLDTLKRIFYQAIWSREILLDMYEPVNMDEPMSLERIDPRMQYRHWLARIS